LQHVLSGKIVKGDELKREARLRKRDSIAAMVPRAEEAGYLEQGFKVKTLTRNRVRLIKRKDSGQLFEDRIWTLFYNMGFVELNQGNFVIGIGRGEGGLERKQIDVLARYSNDVLVIECKSKSRIGKKPLRKDILEAVQLKPAMIAALRSIFGPKASATFVFITDKIDWSRTDRELARRNEIHVWTDSEVYYFSSLTKVLGRATKYQLFGYLFPRRQIHEKSAAVPAIAGRIGEKNVYSFLIQPERLLKIAYVHRRGKVGLDENPYQRMLKKAKLSEIADYIGKGGFFANNIIVNFTQRPRFIGKRRGPINVGRLRLPKRFSSAWVIDGQHRLFGYANSPKASTSLIPVVAFENMTNIEQGELFIEINKKQTAVESNLLWDLAGDIYADAEDDDKLEQWAISTIAKLLNIRKSSPLSGHIFVPSSNMKGGEVNVTITTICTAIQKTGILQPRWLYKHNYPDSTQFAAQRIAAFFTAVKDLNETDWNDGEKGLLRSNNGVSIFFWIFKEVIRYLLFADQHPETITGDNLKGFTGRCKELLEPVKTYLEGLGVEGRKKMRSGSSVGQQKQNSELLMWKIRKQYDKFAPTLERPLDEIERFEEFPIEGDSSRIDNIERALRDLALVILQRRYGDKWWRQGIPGQQKAEIQKRVDEHLRRVPFEKTQFEKDPARKFGFSHIGELRDIITSKPNWSDFAPIFGSIEETKLQFDSLIGHRNQIKHPREVSEHLRRKGIVAILWFDDCRKYAREVVLSVQTLKSQTNNPIMESSARSDTLPQGTS
jgi:DNA sulfur modification protein DndB